MEIILDFLLSKGLRTGLLAGIGDGSNIRFRLDPWIDLEPSCEKFPRIFALSSNKTTMVAEVGLFAHGKWVRDLSFQRPFSIGKLTFMSLSKWQSRPSSLLLDRLTNSIGVMIIRVFSQLNLCVNGRRRGFLTMRRPSLKPP